MFINGTERNSLRLNKDKYSKRIRDYSWDDYDEDRRAKRKKRLEKQIKGDLGEFKEFYAT